MRAKNGWLVAALQTDMPPKWVDHPSQNGNLNGTAAFISRADGRNWTPLNVLFYEGRRTLELSQGMRRVDQPCHGLTWDEMYALDDFPYLEDESWTASLACGHQFSTVLRDGSILTALGNYPCGGELIKWRPEGCS